MTTQLTPGRYRGLKTTSLAHDEIFGIVAFDQRGSYRRMLPDNTPYEEAVALKEEIVGELTKYATAVLLDPVYGLSPAMQMTGKSGLLLALEKSGYSGDDTAREPQFLDTWTPEKIRKMGASAVKLLVYYNPNTGELADRLDALIKQKVAEIHAQDLPVFLEPMSYSTDPDVKKDSAEYAAQKKQIRGRNGPPPEHNRRGRAEDGVPAGLQAQRRERVAGGVRRAKRREYGSVGAAERGRGL